MKIITSEQIANMRKSLLSRIKMKVGDKVVSGTWNDIELDNSTGIITGVYVEEELYRLNQIDYLKTN
jgi:hypothetical protein